MPSQVTTGSAVGLVRRMLRESTAIAAVRTPAIASVAAAGVAVALRRAVFGASASPGPIGGSLLGATVGLGTAAFLAPTGLILWLTSSRRSAGDDALYLCGVSRRQRLRYGMATTAAATIASVVAGAAAGALVGLGDWFRAGAMSFSPDVRLPLGLLGLLLWQLCVAGGISLAFPLAQRAISVLWALAIPIGVAVLFLGPQVWITIGSVLPSGLAVRRLLTVNGDSYFSTGSTATIAAGFGWPLAAYGCAGVRHLVERRALARRELPEKSGER